MANANITVTQGPKTTPTLDIALSTSNITLADSLTVNVKVVPPVGAPTATGTVSLTGNGRTLTASLSGGAAQIVAGPAWLAIGNDSITIRYSGDYNNIGATASASVIVTKAVPTMLVSPAASTIPSGQSLDVSVAVNTAMNVAMPTGTVTLTSGSYTSAATNLLAGWTTITIPAGSLATGTDTLAASYSGDANYTAASATGTVTITAVPASFTVGAANVTISSPGITTGNISTITVTPQGGFTGSVSLSAKVTSSPAGAQYPPTVSFGTTTPVNINGTSGVTAMLTVTTTAPTSAMFVHTTLAHNWRAEGGTALAFLLLLGVPACRCRNWRTWIGVLVLMAGLGNGIVACGGGGNSSGPPPVTTPGTTSGAYVVTITATSGSLMASTTLNVVVQ
jgi:trimeric autotransporter adhesin